MSSFPLPNFLFLIYKFPWTFRFLVHVLLDSGRFLCFLSTFSREIDARLRKIEPLAHALRLTAELSHAVKPKNQNNSWFSYYSKCAKWFEVSYRSCSKRRHLFFFCFGFHSNYFRWQDSYYLIFCCFIVFILGLPRSLLCRENRFII